MIEPVYAGIDVAKDELVLAVCDEQEVFQPERRFPNTKPGIRRLVRHLVQLGEVRSGLEPTSRYHLALLSALAAEPRVVVSVVNSYAARSFARATLIRGKTDRVDAQVLARFVLHCAPAPYLPPRPVTLKLRAITRRVVQLIAQCTAEKNRQHASDCGADPLCVRRSLKRQIAALTREIDRLERQALKLVQAEAELAWRYRLLLSIKGVAQRSALQLLGELGVLPLSMSKQHWVALAGLDPKPQESGQSQAKPRHISRQGHSTLRRALYMPALCAANCRGPARAFKQDLQARGKRPLQILVALMRKLLCAIWGLFETHSPFDPAKFYHRSA
jgi:transposase